MAPRQPGATAPVPPTSSLPLSPPPGTRRAAPSQEPAAGTGRSIFRKDLIAELRAVFPADDWFADFPLQERLDFLAVRNKLVILHLELRPTGRMEYKMR